MTSRKFKNRVLTAGAIALAGAVAYQFYWLHRSVQPTQSVSEQRTEQVAPADPVDTQKYTDQEVRRESLDNYVEKIIDFTTDESKRKIYFILQRHNVDGLGLPEEIEKDIREKVTPNQIGIYRILEYLHKDKNLGVVCTEGQTRDDLEDILQPNYLKNKIIKTAGKDAWDYLIASVESGNNSLITNTIKETRGGASLIASIYPELYGVGFEDPSNKILKGTLAEKMQEALISGDKKFIDEFNEMNTQRSWEAIKYALKHSDDLYAAGKIKNRNAAIVIGRQHFLDYVELARQIAQGKELGYTPIFMLPTGANLEAPIRTAVNEGK